jgi:YD repeat-containing protein
VTTPLNNAAASAHGYDENNNLTLVTAADSTSTAYTFDKTNRLASMTTADGSGRQYVNNQYRSTERIV